MRLSAARRRNTNHAGVYKFLKQRGPNGPECQPGGQLYIGRQAPYGPRCPPGPEPPATWMVSVATDWSSGATGMDCAADIAATPRQIANAEATSIFMDF